MEKFYAAPVLNFLFDGNSFSLIHFFRFSLMENFLTKNQQQELLDELSIESNRHYAGRIRTTLLIDTGETRIDIAYFLFSDEGTVISWRKRYGEGGNNQYFWRVSILEEEQQGERVEKSSAWGFAATKKYYHC